MNRAVRAMIVGMMVVVAGGVAQAELPKEAMEAMQKAGSPSDGHKALEPLAGRWTYAAQWWMAPDAPPQTMTGTAANSLIFGGRFLRQEIHGQATKEQPDFEGLGFIGYDNMRQEYQSIWFDSMATGMMVGAGTFDAATNTLAEQGAFSCPLTQETHRPYRTEWTVVDPDHTTYASYMRAPDGREFKAMEILYTRSAPAAIPCPPEADRC